MMKKDGQTWPCNFKHRFRYRRVVDLKLPPSMSGSWKSETCIKRANLNVEWRAAWLIRCRISKLCCELKCRIADRKDGMWISWKNLKRKYRILVEDITPHYRTVSKSCGPFLHERTIVGLRTDDIEQWTPTSIERLLETKKTTWFSNHYRLQEQLKQLLLHRTSYIIHKFQNV